MLKHRIKGYLSKIIKRGWRRYSGSFNQQGLEPYLVYTKSGYPVDIPIDVDDACFLQEMRQFATHYHQECVYDYTGPCYIEPLHGYIITARFALIEKSFSYHHMFDGVLPRMLWDTWNNSRGRNGTLKRVETAISLRDINEGNYWHFYDDILSKLLVADRLNLSRDVPVLVGERLWKTPYFQSAIQRGTLKQKNWMLHQENIQADRLVFCTKMSLQRENFEFALAALDFQPRQAMASAKRIFLNRGQSQGRYLSNLNQVISVLTDFDFQVVDTAVLELQEQMDLFAQARYVVGVHGAGLVNLIYRQNQELNLLELFAPYHIYPHYVWLCHAFGYGYDAIVGTNTSGEAGQSFTVNLNKLREKVANMLHPAS